MSNLKDVLHIPDTQSERDERHLAIQRVGIKDVRYPMALRLGDAVLQTVAQWDLDVALPAEQKGTHMSRFVAWLDELVEPLDAPVLRSRMAGMLDRLHADSGRIEARFPFFLRKRAPVSGVESLLEYQGRWIVEARTEAASGATSIAVWAEAVVPVKSLCPCSKEISDYGAHNQRSPRHRARRTARRAAVDRTGALRRGQRVERDLADAQARRREVGHRARLREPEVRRGPGPRCRAAPERRSARSAATASTSRTSSRSTPIRPTRASSAAESTGTPAQQPDPSSSRRRCAVRR